MTPSTKLLLWTRCKYSIDVQVWQQEATSSELRVVLSLVPNQMFPNGKTAKDPWLSSLTGINTKFWIGYRLLNQYGPVICSKGVN